MLNPSKVAKKEKKKQFDPKRKQVVSTMKIKVLKWQFYAGFLWCLVEVLGEDFDFEGASTMSLTCCSWFYMVLSEWEGGHGRSTWRMNLLWRLRSVSLCGSGEGGMNYSWQFFTLPFIFTLCMWFYHSSPLEMECMSLLPHIVGSIINLLQPTDVSRCEVSGTWNAFEW